MGNVYQGPAQLPSVTDYAERTWPNKTPAWREAWKLRMAWYDAHNGDMTGAPEFPEGE